MRLCRLRNIVRLRCRALLHKDKGKEEDSTGYLISHAYSGQMAGSLTPRFVTMCRMTLFRIRAHHTRNTLRSLAPHSSSVRSSSSPPLLASKNQSLPSTSVLRSEVARIRPRSFVWSRVDHRLENAHEADASSVVPATAPKVAE
jgi:hypothetical protein